MNTIMRHGTRDYWSLVDLKAIPRETRDYVPKIVAAAIIGENLSQYGFDTPKVTQMSNVSSVQIPSPVSINSLAKSLGVSKKTIRKYNPNITGNLTPLKRKTYKIWLPETMVSSRLAYKISRIRRARYSGYKN